MQSFVIQGGRPLSGTIRASGNKNGALPILAATVLATEEVVLSNLPRIRDVEVMVELLVDLGADAAWTGPNEVRVDSSGVSKTELNPDLCREIRASFLLAGPLLARFGRAVVPPPGGDVIGRRRLDTHIHAFAELGVTMEINGAYDLRAEKLVGKRMYLDEASVMGTENAIMAAVLAEGETIVGHAACEPHIQDLCRFLVGLGAEIEGIGSNVLRIQGVDRLRGGSYRIGPEHIEVASFAVLAAVTGGDLTIEEVEPDDLIAIVPGFRKLGIEFEVGPSTLRVRPGQKLAVVDDLGGQIPKLESGIWPAFPADLTSIAVVAATQATGTVLVFEKMFESRLFFVDKLVSMGARIILCDPHRAVITGPAKLVRPTAREPRHPCRHGNGHRRPLCPGSVEHREHPSDRPRLRAHRRTTSRPRRRYRACGAVSGARLAPGSGEANVATGVPLLDHLLTEFAAAGRFDLSLEVDPGDPAAEVDAAGVALGQAVGPLLRSGAHGSGVMLAAEALAMVVVESSGNALLASNANLTGAGGLGTDIAARFLSTLTSTAVLTLHVRLIEGEDTDHVLEAIFKALGVALADALNS